MPKRICWKKGMRLTDDILRASDQYHDQRVGNALMLAAVGRFGLIPSPTPFKLSLNISNNFIDVEALSCFAVTKNGEIIDVQYDTRYTDLFDTRVQIPSNEDEKEYILTIANHEEKWKETVNGFEEPVYTFNLVAPHTPIAEDALPIGRIVANLGWRADEIDFVPPCLFVSSHPRYTELLTRFSEVLTEIDTKVSKTIWSTGKEAVKVFWPIVQQLRITIDKEWEMMTPMMLLAQVQKCVSAFTCACDIDENLDLADADTFRNYVWAPYNYKDAYLRIKEGLELCFSISEKVEKLQATKKPANPQKTNAPIIADEHLFQNCRAKSVSIPVSNYSSEATVLYSIDGGEPSKKLPKSGSFSIENGFNKMKVPEPDKTISVRLKAILNGVSSDVNTYTITLHKDYKKWDGYEI